MIHLNWSKTTLKIMYFACGKLCETLSFNLYSKEEKQ